MDRIFIIVTNGARRLNKWVQCLILFAAVLGSPAFSQEIPVTFIGNCAFRIQLDSLLLFSDFPYKPGAYGYMKYDLENVYHDEKGIALITHKHNDHFSRSLFSRTKLKKAGPKVSLRQREELVKDYGLTITPVKTKHKWSFKHNSYSVKWKDRRIYFTGDTENYDKLLEEKDFDILFITPWLLQRLMNEKIKLKAKTVILYHHRDSQETFQKERAAICDCNLISPAQQHTYMI